MRSLPTLTYGSLFYFIFVHFRHPSLFRFHFLNIFFVSSRFSHNIHRCNAQSIAGHSHCHTTVVSRSNSFVYIFFCSLSLCMSFVRARSVRARFNAWNTGSLFRHIAQAGMQRILCSTHTSIPDRQWCGDNERTGIVSRKKEQRRMRPHRDSKKSRTNVQPTVRFLILVSFAFQLSVRSMAVCLILVPIRTHTRILFAVP